MADPVALKNLAHALLSVAKNPNSFERVQLHTSDGHEYTAMIVSGVSEEEWQTIPPAYGTGSVPTIGVLEDYHAIKQELTALK